MEQLLLVTFCDSPAGIGASLQTDGRTDGRKRTNGWTDRRDVENSILDLLVVKVQKVFFVARTPFFAQSGPGNGINICFLYNSDKKR